MNTLPIHNTFMHTCHSVSHEYIITITTQINQGETHPDYSGHIRSLQANQTSGVKSVPIRSLYYIFIMAENNSKEKVPVSAIVNMHYNDLIGTD